MNRGQCRASVNRGISFTVAPPAALLPKFLCDREWIDIHVVPPGSLIAGMVQLPMVDAAEWHGELVTDLFAHRTRLRKTKVMGIGRRAIAEQTRLLADEEKM